MRETFQGHNIHRRAGGCADATSHVRQTKGLLELLIGPRPSLPGLTKANVR